MVFLLILGRSVDAEKFPGYPPYSRNEPKHMARRKFLITFPDANQQHVDAARPAEETDDSAPFRQNFMMWWEQ